MDALERFNNPAAYVVERLEHACFTAIDSETIGFSFRGDGYSVRIHREEGITIEGKAQFKQYDSTLRLLQRAHRWLEKESLWYPLKRAVLHSPPPPEGVIVTVSQPKAKKSRDEEEWSDEDMTLLVSQGDRHDGFDYSYRVHPDGRVAHAKDVSYGNKQYQVPALARNYAWALAIYLVDGYAVNLVVESP